MIMEVTRTDLCLHSDFNDGAVTFGVYLSPEADCDDDELNEAIIKWANDEEVFLNFRFSLSDCVFDMINNNRYINEKGIVFGEKDRPMVESLRDELTKLISVIDEIKIVPE
jgi:hypothetical protein